MEAREALAYSVIAAALISCITFCIGPRDDSWNYILSSVSQGLAAVFALVFTITLVVAQVSSKYSIRIIRLIFSPWTVLLMFFYAAGIVAPLLVMQSQNEILLDLCIGLDAFCIFLLIPYSFYLRDQFNPVSHVKSFLKKVDLTYIEELRRVHEDRLSRSMGIPSYSTDVTGGQYWFNVPNDPLVIVLEIMTRALKEGDFETFISSLNEIR